MFKKALFYIFITLSALTLGACDSSSSSDDDSDPTRNYMGTQSPGDLWSWTITTGSGGSGTFSASNDTLGFTYSGDVATLANGFLQLTVTATTDPGLTPPEVAYALEFPGTALVIKPVADGDAIVAVALGSCPTADATYNWVDLLDSSWDSATLAAYGVSNSTVTGSNFDFSHTSYYINGTPFLPPPPPSPGFTCSGGRLTYMTDPMVIVATPSGAFIGDKGPGAGGFVGMQAPSSAIDLSDVVLAGREYRGVIFEDGSLGDDTRPVWARPDGLGGLTGGEWDDFVANVENTTDTATITFGAQASPGVVNATLTDSSDTGDMVLMINIINGKYFIYGANIDTVSGVGTNFLIIEQ